MHPYVGQDEVVANETSVLVNPGGVGFYTQAIFRFLVEAQSASIGQVSENLTECTAASQSLFTDYRLSREQSRNGQHTLSAYSLNTVIQSIDPVVFSCFFTLFEYSDAM